MADFYQELLGSLDKSPLDQLAQRDATAASGAAPVIAASSTFKAALSRSATEASSGNTELLPKQVASISKPLPERPVLVDALVARGVLSAPVLKGALPKLAPAEQTKEATRQDSKLDIAPEAIKNTVQEASETPVAKRQVGAASPDVIKVVSTRKGSDPRSSTEVASTSEAIPVAKQNLAWHDNGRPHWAQDRFECLLFVVAGLTLAVPLVSLGAIYRLEGELTPLVGRASWFMGLYRQGERSVQVVDTAQWVMPDRWTPEVRANYRFVIRLGDDNWGVATDAVQQSINLSPEQVKWRTERSKRPWLAGTVVEHMCALLDADKLAQLLSQDAVRARR